MAVHRSASGIATYMVPIWVLFVENAYSGVRAIVKWYST